MKKYSSNPASSTKPCDGLAPARPLQTLSHKLSNHFNDSIPWVSEGLEKALKCLENDYLGRVGVTYADSITRDIGTRECQAFREKFFNRYEPVCHEVAHEYLRISEQKTHVEANRFLGNLQKELQIHDLNLTDLNKLPIFAERMAALCGRVYAANRDFTEHCVNACTELLTKYRLPPPQSNDKELFEQKVTDSKFWLNKLKILARQTLEHVRRQCSIVNNSQSPYCSNKALKDWQFCQEQNKAYMESTYIQNDQGECLSLAQVASSNVSNPRIRRCEMMVRIRGFEEVASINGHVGDFYTLTTPSKMHSHHKSGSKNIKYDGTTTKQANEYMQRVWQCIRAKLDRDDLRIYGVRVVEPHHDSTPHWHLMLFMHPDDRLKIRNVISHYALEEDRNEAGADRYRVKCTEIDPAKGSASGYIAKYIAKNIDGEYLDSDTYGNDAKTSAKRITAWASLNRIRQFQFIGGPSVTLWRQLRKLKDDYSEDLQPYAEPANKSNWAAFVLAMGGVLLPRTNRPLSLEYEASETAYFDTDTGEVFEPESKTSLSLSNHPVAFRLADKIIPIVRRIWTLKPSPPI